MDRAGSIIVNFIMRSVNQNKSRVLCSLTKMKLLRDEGLYGGNQREQGDISSIFSLSPCGG